MPDQEEVEFVRENVTVIFKSFERQKMAKRLYENLQKYYPGVRVVIADDSRKPLDLQGDSLTIIQLPFNSGLSYGMGLIRRLKGWIRRMSCVWMMMNYLQ